ncbi:MAG: hypothetical protein KatS3mg104_1244 [Phycisphaerae bacterium]|nr:MAG: hypothetical protein KatS3mg104_1244 [Phycisphaerae bacterium]
MADPIPDPQSESQTPDSASKSEASDPLTDELLAMGTFTDASAEAASSTGDSGVSEPPLASGSASSQTPLNPEEVAPDLAELEALLKQAGFDGPGENIDLGSPSDANALADQLIADAQSASTEPSQPPPATQPFDLPTFQQVLTESQASSIDLIRDVELNVKIELGRSRMLVEDVLKLSEGAVVELDKLAGDPVDVYVNDRLVARGEVLVLNDNFCVRVNEIVASVKEES